MKISVIICSHNPRPVHLHRVLNGLRAQTMPLDQWELLLIDSASDTPLSAGWDLAWHPLGRHVREDQPGIIPARLCGVREAAADLRLFLADHQVVNRDFLEQAELIHQQRPFIGVFGAGSLRPEFEVPPPQELLPYVALLGPREVPSELWSNHLGDSACLPRATAICATRQTTDSYREIIRQMNAGQTLGKAGAGLACGEDDLFAWAALQTGHAFGIFPSLQLTQLVAADRLTPARCLRRLEDQKYSHGILDYLSTGTRPPAPTFSRIVLLLLGGLRHGMFELRCRLAEGRGCLRAGQYLVKQQLQPFFGNTGGFTGLPGGSTGLPGSFYWNSRLAPAGVATGPAQPTPAPATRVPLISVVIPAFNREKFIVRAVESVLNQTFRDFELIVVDDGSTDNTVQMLAPYAGRIRLICQANSGVSATRNRGIRAATGRWIAFLDSDDWWKPQKLERQMHFIEKYGVKICFTRCKTDSGDLWRDIEEVVAVTREPGVVYVTDSVTSVCEARRHPYVQSMVVDRELLELVGLFDESFYNADDTRLLFRLSFHTGYLYLLEPLVVIQIGTDNSLTYCGKPEVIARRLNCFLRVQMEMYSRLLLENPPKSVTSRVRLAYYSLRRAQLASATGNVVLCRALARNVIFLGGGWRIWVSAVLVYVFPRLMRRACRQRFGLS